MSPLNNKTIEHFGEAEGVIWKDRSRQERIKKDKLKL